MLSVYVYASLETVGACALSNEPSDTFAPLPAPPRLTAKRSVVTDAPFGAAMLESAPAEPRLDTEPITPVYDASSTFSSVTAAAPDPPRMYVATIPLVAAAGDTGHMTEIVG